MNYLNEKSDLRDRIAQLEKITAEVSADPQHGPVVTVCIGEARVSVYLYDETCIVTTPEGRQYGLEVSGPWFAVRSQLAALKSE